MTIPVSYPVYPFSALVGQERLKRALMLNVINTRIGGVLIRGEKGTAKSTAVRGLARLLPPITVVNGCPYHCQPDHPAGLCHICTSSQLSQPSLPFIEQPTHLIELPVSASEDRVVGSLDLEHAVTEGKRRFEPGLLAQVNRGILYVDEVNLLDDHLVDVLLDAAAMGINTVEREGISVSHPARFILVGTMNPEEGELRPQLLDRFGLAVEVRGLTDVASRIAVIERRLAYEMDPEGFMAKWHHAEQKLSKRIVTARQLLPFVRISKTDMLTVANISLELDVDGHRADLTILEAARAHAAWEGRKRIQPRDIQLAAELALPHRMRRQPFLDVGIEDGRVGSVLERIVQFAQDVKEQRPKHEKKTLVNDQQITEAIPHAEWDGARVTITRSPQANHTRDQATDSADQERVVYKTDEVFRVHRIEGQGDRTLRQSFGRRSHTLSSSRKQGRYIRSKQSRQVNDLAFDASLRAAAPYQRSRHMVHPQPMMQAEDNRFLSIATTLQTQEKRKFHQKHVKIILYRDDLRQKIRSRRTRNAVCFVVDASWSMAAEERMKATKAAVLSLLRDAYQRRDVVGLVSFQRTQAHILLPLTSSVELAQKQLQIMPVGGKTPLARGLLTGYELLEQAKRRDSEIIPLLVIITDGQANVSMTHMPPQQEAYRVAELIAHRHIRSIVIDTEYSQTAYTQALSGTVSAHASPRWNTVYANLERGLARYLAEYLKAQYYRLEDLREEGLARTVRTQMYIAI